MVLLRRVIGDALRARRLSQHRTLREVSTAAKVSLGYLSEIERGHKEASSELLASICDALGARLSEVLGEVTSTLAVAERLEPVVVPATDAVTENGVTVQVRRDGPFKTTLKATRAGASKPPGPRRREAACAA